MARKNHGKKRRTRAPVKQPLNKKGTRFRAPVEWIYQKEIMSILRDAGWKVFNTSEPRARMSITDDGIPDLICFHLEKGILLFFEAKRPTAVGPHDEEIWSKKPTEMLREAQREFRDYVATVREVHHVKGATEALLEYLGVKTRLDT